MSDIIYTPPASSGGGGQNPTANFLPLNDGSANFVDSNLLNFIDNKLSTIFSNGDEFGINVNFASYRLFLGDFNSINNSTLIYLDDTTQVISTLYQGNDYGLFFDYANREFYFGDFTNVGNGTCLFINEYSDIIYTRNATGNQGISLDLATNSYKFGDFQGIGNATNINIKDSAKQITFNTVGGTIRFETDLLFFSGSLLTPTSGGFSGRHLQVTINGTPYVIRLENP